MNWPATYPRPKRTNVGEWREIRMIFRTANYKLDLVWSWPIHGIPLLSLAAEEKLSELQ